jgi:hypothetical protein
MKHIPLQLAILATLAAGAVAGQTYALEAATTGSQATQATVGAINSKVDTSIAALQAQIGGMTYCNSIRKFYAPTDPKKDANGCVGTGDYDLNMASGNNVNFTNGRVYATQNASSNWGGLFYGPADYGGVYGQAGIYGVYGYATGNGYGVVGNATANSGGIGGSFSGGNSGVRGYGSTYGLYGYSASNYGVYGESSSGYGVRGASSSSWGGVFTGSYYGVYGSGSTYGVYSNGPLCVNGLCSRRGFGGTFTWNTDGWCYRANPETGGCSCPSGFGAYYGTGGFSHLDLYICE